MWNATRIKISVFQHIKIKNSFHSKCILFISVHCGFDVLKTGIKIYITKQTKVIVVMLNNNL